MKPELIRLLKIAFKIGGPGSGNFGHSGRPGLIGGSAPSKGGWASPPRAYSGGGGSLGGASRSGRGDSNIDKETKSVVDKFKNSFGISKVTAEDAITIGREVESRIRNNYASAE